MALTWALNGFLCVIIIVTLLTLPLFFTLPFAEALTQSRYAIILTGWLWLLTTPATLTIIYMVRILRKR